MNSSHTLFNGNDLIINFLALAEKDLMKALQQPITLEHVREAVSFNQFFTTSNLDEKFHAWIEDILKTYSKKPTNAILKFIAGDDESSKVNNFFNFIRDIKGWQSFSGFEVKSEVQFQKPSGIDKSSEQKHDSNQCLLQSKTELTSVNFSEACSMLAYRAQSFASKQKLDELLKKCKNYKIVISSSKCDEEIMKKLDEFIERLQQRLKFTNVYTPPVLDSKNS